MASIAIVGAGSVGRALGAGFTANGHSVTYGVRDPVDTRHADLVSVATQGDAVRGADVIVVAVPADAVPSVVRGLGLRAGQVVLDATNAVRVPVPDGFATMGDLVTSLVPTGVAVAKAFNTVGAEHLGGHRGSARVFLPIAGDANALVVASTLAGELGFEVTALGGRERFAMVEDHAQLWIHLAFSCGWGREFAFTVTRS